MICSVASFRRQVFQIFLVVALLAGSNSFSLVMTTASKSIYGIPDSGWASSQWNWGYAVGTGHDCALVCRRKYDTRRAREDLVNQLCSAPSKDVDEREPKNFEEVKLILALAWQRGRWDGSDGGKGGYGDVLRAMEEATRYESKSDDENSVLLVEDMMARFPLLSPSPEKLKDMNTISWILTRDNDAARRKCSGLVLQSMGFVESGL